MKMINVNNNEDFITGYNQALEDIDSIITEFQSVHNEKFENYLQGVKENFNNINNGVFDEICTEQSILLALSKVKRIMLVKRSNFFKELDNEED